MGEYGFLRKKPFFLSEQYQAAFQSIRQIEEMNENRKERYSPAVQRAVEYVKENYQNGLTLPAVASRAGFSPDPSEGHQYESV